MVNITYLIQDLIQLLLVDSLRYERGGRVEADPGLEVPVPGEPGDHVAAPACAHCSKHLGSVGPGSLVSGVMVIIGHISPGIWQYQITHLRLPGSIPI